MAADNIETHKMFSLEQLALHQIAKQLWNILVLEYSEIISVSSMELRFSSLCDLKKYQANVLKVMELLPPGFPKLFKDKLVMAMINLRLGYVKAYDWIIKYRYLIFEIERKPITNFFDKIFDERYLLKLKYENALQSFFTCPDLAKYEASCFINPLGKFDDLSWAKIFVAEEKLPLHSRFFLACYYCFEETINNLWCTMVSEHSLPSEDNLPWMIDEYHIDGDLYRVWSSREKNKITDEEFYSSGFSVASIGSHEHAATYFWKHCSVEERAKILSEFDFKILAAAASTDNVGFVYFIYSLLPLELKKSLVSFAILEKRSSIFTSMLCSYCYESILSDLLILPDSETFELFEQILDSLVPIIRTRSIPVHKEIFKVLWNHLLFNDRNLNLRSSRIFSKFLTIRDFDLIEMVILPLPRSMKEKVLLTDWQMGGQFMLSSYFMRNDFERLFCYLLFFFLDCDAANHRLVLRSDSSNLLDRFITCETYVKWIRIRKYDFFEENDYVGKFETVIQDFKETLPVLDELLNKANEKDHAISFYDFLSEHIYPFLSLKCNKYKSGSRFFRS